MSCCGGDLRTKMVALQKRLAAQGESREAKVTQGFIDKLDRLATRERRVVSKLEKRQAAPPQLPKSCKKYYEQCRKKPPSTVKDRGTDAIQEYCSRVAWQICCQAGKGGPHCGELGLTKKRGPLT